jgi:SHS2 domain-containing protein
VSAGYRILEHTADIGIEAWGPTAERAFEQAAWGLAEILGAQVPGSVTGTTTIEATGADRGALLVDFLNELLLLHETGEVGFASVVVTAMDDTSLRAEVEIVPLQGETETTGIKAATYHRLEVTDTEDGVRARVYLDV